MAASGDPKKRRSTSGRVTPKGAETSGTPSGGGKTDAKADSAASTRKVKKVPKPAKTSKKDDDVPVASRRYTPPTAKADKLPSPPWVPVLMFIFWGLGMLVIFLSYLSVLPGGSSNWYLLVGLGLILAGIVTATQYR